jgi:NAD(P)-dependent dehydrogenase (short-subunit alcohol dehydrogenase family)
MLLSHMKAIVTGHSRGLGAAIADDLLGRRIAVLGISRARNPALARRFPGTLEEVELDLADSAALERWLAGKTMRAFVAGTDPVLLVNNAGVLQPIGPLESQDQAAVARAVGVNVAAALVLAAAFVQATADANERRIVHISSGAARAPYAGWSVYCATKAALDHHARAVALDATPRLRICSVAPGVVDTDMQTEIRASPLDRFPLRGRFEELKERGHLATPVEAARRVVEYALRDRFGDEPTVDLRPPGR